VKVTEIRAEGKQSWTVLLDGMTLRVTPGILTLGKTYRLTLMEHTVVPEVKSVHAYLGKDKISGEVDLLVDEVGPGEHMVNWGASGSHEILMAVLLARVTDDTTALDQCEGELCRPVSGLS